MIHLPAAPTFAQLVSKLEADYQCACREIPGADKPPVWEITRTVDGEELYDVRVIEWDDWPLTPTLVRSICSRLKVDPEEAFGPGVTGWA